MNDPIKKRLIDKFKKIPKWSEDFPLESQKDSNVSRRDFIRYLGLVSFGFLLGMAGVWAKSILKNTPVATPARMKIIDKADLKVGESYVFEVPGRREQAILVRLSEDQYTAYGQKCTHLQCPVIWKKDEGILFCPCHKGAFNATTGDVLYGPPERPLPQLRLEIASDAIYYVGMQRGELS